MQQALQHVRQLLAPGGYFLIQELDPGNYPLLVMGIKANVYKDIPAMDFILVSSFELFISN